MIRNDIMLKYEKIQKAKESCKNSGINEFEHFVGADKLSKRANNAEVLIKDYKLTRYACYLIAQNGDSRKKLLLLLKHILQFKPENKKSAKKNIVC